MRLSTEPRHWLGWPLVSIVPVIVHGLSRLTKPSGLNSQLLDFSGGKILSGVSGGLRQRTEQFLLDQNWCIDDMEAEKGAYLRATFNLAGILRSWRNLAISLP